MVWMNLILGKCKICWKIMLRIVSSAKQERNLMHGSAELYVLYPVALHVFINLVLMDWKWFLLILQMLLRWEEQQGNAERIREFKMGFESWRNVLKEKADGELQNWAYAGLSTQQHKHGRGEKQPLRGIQNLQRPIRRMWFTNTEK